MPFQLKKGVTRGKPPREENRGWGVQLFGSLVGRTFVIGSQIRRMLLFGEWDTLHGEDWVVLSGCGVMIYNSLMCKNITSQKGKRHSVSK